MQNLSNRNYRIHFDLFAYTIPFASFILDHSIKKISFVQRTEKNIWVLVKFAMIVYYLGIYVMSLENKSYLESDSVNIIYTMSMVNLLLFPVISIVYSYSLYKGYLV